MPEESISTKLRKMAGVKLCEELVKHGITSFRWDQYTGRAQRSLQQLAVKLGLEDDLWPATNGELLQQAFAWLKVGGWEDVAAEYERLKAARPVAADPPHPPAAGEDGPQ